MPSPSTSTEAAKAGAEVNKKARGDDGERASGLHGVTP